MEEQVTQPKVYNYNVRYNDEYMIVKASHINYGQNGSRLEFMRKDGDAWCIVANFPTVGTRIMRGGEILPARNPEGEAESDTESDADDAFSLETLTETMDIRASYGDQVMVTEKSAKNGHGGAPLILDLYTVYHVDYTEVHGWHTDVYLVEFPQKDEDGRRPCFNSVNFVKVKPR